MKLHISINSLDGFNDMRICLVWYNCGENTLSYDATIRVGALTHYLLRRALSFQSDHR